MITHTDRATILIEALPYIQRFQNSTFVIKYGGHAMVDETLKQEFALEIILMKYCGSQSHCGPRRRASDR